MTHNESKDHMHRFLLCKNISLTIPKEVSNYIGVTYVTIMKNVIKLTRRLYTVEKEYPPLYSFVIWDKKDFTLLKRFKGKCDENLKRGCMELSGNYRNTVGVVGIKFGLDETLNVIHISFESDSLETFNVNVPLNEFELFIYDVMTHKNVSIRLLRC
jgi:hypothetical protein